MKLFKLATSHLIILATSVAFSFGLQADMSDKEHKDHEKQMQMPMKAGLMVMNGWVRLTPPIAKNSAAYFVFHNSSDKDITVVGASSKIAKMTMMHDVVMEKSMAKMVHLDKVKVPAGGQVEFAPGGKHLMFVGLTEKLDAAKDVTVKFTLDSGEVITTVMKVKAESKSMSGGHNH
ncbi:MAG: copper chaperone PCu(A)C [Gammaproteobacteria bacterium]|nr:copper chaperone PCu(A)C [Gammaproteobacteria bacterium]